MKIAYISYADESTEYKFNVQIVKDEVYTPESFYTNDLFEAFERAEDLGCDRVLDCM